MEKKKIETFIKKYSLDGTIESVVWMNDNNDLHTRAMTSDKKLFSSVRFDGGASNFIDKGQELVILATDKLEKMISVLGDNVSLTLDVDEKDKNRILQLIVDDGSNQIFYVASEPTAIDAVPSMKNIPPFEVELNMTPAFITSFNKSYFSLSDDATLFTLLMNKKKKLELVMGYKQNLSDRVVLSVDVVPGKDTITNPINFTAKNLKSILSSNSEVENSVLKVSSAGLASIGFDKDGFKSQYYMVKVDVED